MCKINKVKNLSLWNSYDHSIGCRTIKGPDKPGHYSILDIYDNSESQALFHEYKFLLGIFNKNKDLKKKLELIALKNNFKNWINYFYIQDNLDNDEYNKENLLDELKKIKKITSDYELIKLIDKVTL